MEPKSAPQTTDVERCGAPRTPPKAHAFADVQPCVYTVVRSGPSSSSSSSNISFRDVDERDIPGLMQLQRELFPVQYSESFYAKLFTPGYYCLVGLAPGGEIVAVASARVVPYDSPHDPQTTKEAYIMTLGVKDSYRRRQLGTRVMELILQLLRSRTHCDYAALHVKTLNIAAVRYYERLGFTCDPNTGFLPSHYFIDGQHWDAYRYTRPLRSPLMALVKDYCALL